MSVEYYICCHECKIKAHIGCEGFSGLQFWSGDATAMKAMRSLLLTCLFHEDKIGIIKERSDEAEEYRDVI